MITYYNKGAIIYCLLIRTIHMRYCDHFLPFLPPSSFFFFFFFSNLSSSNTYQNLRNSGWLSKVPLVIFFKLLRAVIVLSWCAPSSVSSTTYAISMYPRASWLRLSKKKQAAKLLNTLAVCTCYKPNTLSRISLAFRKLLAASSYSCIS
jgi:hypothetical protein